MTSSSNPISPLAFTRAYNTYRAESANIPFADSRLLAGARFWTPFGDSLTDPVLSSFIEEDWPPLLLQDPETAEDLGPTEIEEIARFLDLAASHRRQIPGAPAASGALSRSALFWQAAARKHLYIGEPGRAIDALEHARMIDRRAMPPAPRAEDFPADCDPTQMPEDLAGWAEPTYPAAAHWLREIRSRWIAQQETGEINQARCLVVEYDSNGRPVRGRIRDLTGAVEEIKRKDASDEVTVHHQVRAPDDPHFGAIYNALAALRRQVGHRGEPVHPRSEPRIRHPEERSDEGSAFALRGPHFHARLTLGPGNTESHTGDSIGLAAFALAYANWWASDIHRERRLIGTAVAFTGGIAHDGKLTPVSTSTLCAKIERAFHSPLTHVVIPESNRRDAEFELTRLREMHPHRRLHLIGAETAGDVITDHNILRTEKVCLGEFAARKAARWGRSVRVQVVVLLALIYLLVCQVYPRAWLFFDREPHHIIGQNRGFDVYNSDSTLLWSVDFGQESILDGIQSEVGDLDGDGHNEVLVNPKCPPASSLNSHFVLFDHKGNERFRRPNIVLGGHPSDTSLLSPTDPSWARIIYLKGKSLIVTIGNREYPARGHVQVWTPNGDLAGWYVNRGYVGPVASRIAPDGSPQFIIGAINNPMRSAAIFVIPAEGASGVSPPYVELDGAGHRVKLGNQLQYILMPPGEVNHEVGHLYNAMRDIKVHGDGSIRVDVDETLNVPHPERAFVSFEFDSAFQLIRVGISDTYVATRQRLVEDHRLVDIPPNRLKLEHSMSVRWWGGNAWTRNP